MPPRLNIPPLTRGLLTALVVFSLLDAAARYRSWAPDRSDSAFSRRYYAPYLTLVPGASITYPWVFLIATFAEQNVAGLFITGAGLFYGGRYLERAWSSREYTKFMLLICVVPNFITFVVYIALFAITHNEGLVTTSISGGIAIQAAFLVAFKQLVPEHTVTLAKGLLSMRVKHFTAIFLLANTISGLAFSTDTAMLLAWLGFLTSWVYLRFYRVSPSSVAGAAGDGSGAGSTTLRGDASDTFAFASFFPDVIQPPVAAVADAVYAALVAIRVCTPFTADDVDAGNAQAGARRVGELPSLMNPGGGGNSSRREEAERRRALALRALDQRLQAGHGTGAGGKQQQPAMAVAAASSGPSMLGETTYDPEPEPARPRSMEQGS